MMTSNAVTYVYRSKCNRKPFSFRWEIEEFEECLVPVAHFLSPVFKVDNGARRLRVSLERKQGRENGGDDDDVGDWLSVSLQMPSVDLSSVSFSIALLRSPPKEDYRKTVQVCQLEGLPAKQKFEFPKFIRYADLVNPVEGFLKDGHQLTVLVEGSFFDRQEEDCRSIDLTSENLTDLKAELNRQPIENLRKLLDERILTDFTVKARDANGLPKKLKVHRNILAVGSKVFATMFKNPELKECQEEQVEIEDFQFEVMEALIRFLYTGELPLNAVEGRELDLLVAADKYQIDGLKKLVEWRLIESLSVESVCELFANADHLKASLLRARCAEFIRRRRKLVLKTKGWNNLSQRLMTFVFSGDEEIDENSDDDDDHQIEDGGGKRRRQQ